MKSLPASYRVCIILGCLSTCLAINRLARAVDAGGLVTDTLGKPIVGATVEAVELHGVGAWPQGFSQKVVGSAVSGADGSYRLSASPPVDPADQIMLRAVAPDKAYSEILYRPDFPPEERFRGSAQMGSMRRPWFVMVPEQTIRGIIVDEQGQPVPGCAIRSRPMWQTASSGPDGKFQIEHFSDLSGTPFEDSRQMEFAHPDYLIERMYLRSDQYRVRQADGTWRITLRTGVLINGKATDQDSKEPIAGARIQVGGGAGIAVTNAQGEYVIRAPTEVQLTITPLRGAAGNPNYVPVERDLTQTFAADRLVVDGIDFHYRKGQSISGTVHPTAGEFVQGVLVTLTKSVPPPVPQVGSSPVAPDGTFRINGIVPGSYDLHVMLRPGSPTQAVASKPVEVVAGRDVEGLTIDAALVATAARGARGPQNTAGVWIKVVNPDGTPVKLGVLRMAPSWEFTDLNGEFRSQRASTSYRVAVTSNYEGTLSGVARLDRTVEPTAPTLITLGPSARISGRFYDADGNPLAGRNVQLNFDSMGIGVIWTDAEGKYSFTGLVPLQPGDRYTVSASQMSSHSITELQPGQELAGVNFRYMGPNSGPRGFVPERE